MQISFVINHAKFSDYYKIDLIVFLWVKLNTKRVKYTLVVSEACKGVKGWMSTPQEYYIHYYLLII